MAQLKVCSLESLPVPNSKLHNKFELRTPVAPASSALICCEDHQPCSKHNPNLNVVPSHKAGDSQHRNRPQLTTSVPVPILDSREQIRHCSSLLLVQFPSDASSQPLKETRRGFDYEIGYLKRLVRVGFCH
jgi:hypothetical protein